MKKHFAAVSAVGMALASSLCAQSLYDLAPDETETDSLPLTWTAGINLGYDDNPTPLLGGDDESFYGQAYIGAAFLNNSPQTTLAVGAQIGVIHYFDNLDVAGFDVDDTSFTASVYLNLTHRISERLRFVSRNSLAYELEPDYSQGFQSSRQVGNYFRWFTDNALGYRWTERLATYTGFRLNGIEYEEDAVLDADRFTWTIYNDFRYQLTQQTVATFSARYSETDGDGAVSDSENIYLLAGLEHRFSPRAIGIVRAGVQLRDVDGGGDSTSPYAEASLRVQSNEQFTWRAYARYGIEDYVRSVRLDPLVAGGPRNRAVFEDNQSLRLGLSGTYAVSQALSLNAGVNYIMNSFEDGVDIDAGGNTSDIDEDLFNAYVGFNLALSDNLFLNGTYNFEDFSSDVDSRDYDRNRFSLGVSTQF